MSLIDTFYIAASGMDANAKFLNTTASNIANASSMGAKDKVYKAKVPIYKTVAREEQASFFNDNKTYGVSVTGIKESKAPLKVEYNPHHPEADQDGNVFLTNVDPMLEMANMLTATRGFGLSAEVAASIGELAKRTLEV